MPLWLKLLWPKPKARQQYSGNRNINLQFATRTFAITPTVATTTTITMTTLLHVVIINVLLLTTMAKGLSNGYATPSYVKNYYQITEAETTGQQQQQKQQQQQHLQQQSNVAVTAAAIKAKHEGEMGAGGVIGRGFMGLQSNNYGNSFVARGGAIAAQSALQNGGTFNIYAGGFVPTSFTPAGHHYATSLEGLQSAIDKNNALQQYGTTTAANKNNFNLNHPAYDNGNSNKYNTIATTDNKATQLQQQQQQQQEQHSMFRRLSNYGGLNNFRNGGLPVEADTTGANDNGGGRDDGDSDVEDERDVEVNGGTGRANNGVVQNYALAYADDAEQSAMLQNFYNQQSTAYNEANTEPEQTFANYFPPAMTTATAAAGYEIENPQKYYTFNNYQQQQQTTKPQQQEQQTYLHYQPQAYEQQQQQQQLQHHHVTATPAPATYFQSIIQHKNDDNNNNNREHHHQHRHIAGDNYYNWKQNHLMTSYQQKQLGMEKLSHTQQSPANNHYLQQQPSIVQEPETAETSHSARFKKSPKHKSKRHDNQEHNYSYDTYEHNDIETEKQDLSAVQLEHLQQLQQQLHQQQQQFIELQHQLIDHDQQLQIQKQIAHTPAPALPPITHTVHHNPHSLQALAGTPLTKHTQIIKTIPIPQRHQVHVPYRENVTIEVPDPIITTISKPLAIEIPITKTVTIPKIQEVKIPIEKLKPVPVERPIPYIVEKRVPYAVEKQVAKPVYYPVPIKVPIVHTVVHKVHSPHHDHYHHEPHVQPHQYHKHQSIHLPHTVYRSSSHGSGHKRVHGHSHVHHYLK
ncbi:uncharacterized protein ACRADG_013048 [Cochliomyia hominivorax]